MRALTLIRTAPVRVSARIHGGDPDAGSASAEYAVATVAACGFGGILWGILKSDFVVNMVKALFNRALHTNL